MRPLQLELSAFGPFPTKHQVDFGLLADLGIYLIAGNTGAGKTSILDAMVYALYGEVPGMRGDGALRLRSDFAEASLTTTITFEFEAQGTVWRIHRTPSQEVAKQRGEGMRTIPAKATLERRTADGSWTEEESGIKPVGARAKDLTGLDHKQFSQVVLLPQGRFERVLKADRREREELMRTLFETSGFHHASIHLKDLATERRRAAERAELTAETWTDSAGSAWDNVVRGLEDAVEKTETQIAKWDDEEETDPVDESESRLPYIEGVLISVNEALETARVELTGSQEYAQQMKDAAERISEIVKYRNTISRLDETEVKATEDTRRLEQARVADPVVTELKLLSERHDVLVASQFDHDELVGALLDAELADSDIPESAVVATRLANKWTKNAQRYTEFVDNLTGADEEEAVADDCRNAVVALLTNVDELTAELAEVTEHKTRLESDFDESTNALEGLTVADRAVETARRGIDAVSVIRDERKNLAAREKIVRTTVKELQSATVELERARQLEAEHVAAGLAQKLDDGEPCPVCGSLEHPHPAIKGKGSPVALTEIEKFQSEAIAAKSTAEANVRNTKSALTRAEKLATKLDVTDLPSNLRTQIGLMKKVLRDAEGALKNQKALANQRPKVDKALKANRVEAETIQSELAEARSEIKTQKALGLDAEKQVKRIRSRVARAIGKDADPQGLAETATEIAEILSDFVGTKSSLELATARHEEQVGKVDVAIQVSGFADQQEVHAAVLSDEDKDLISAQLNDRRNEREHAERRIAELEAGELPEDQPNVDAAEAKVKSTAKRVSDLEEVVTTIVERRDVYQKMVEQAQSHRADADHARGAANLAGRIDGACRGTATGQKLSLEAWVLARYLRDVAKEASARLLLMSSGRYRFEVVDEDEGGHTVGLRIDIEDLHTCETRSVSTLSGGETFLASLSLALGLADTVQRRAGGVQIDCLFVDEGFGALDSDTLELAIDTLADLREGGRTVGVISHVDGVRDRLDLGLRIEKTQRGSIIHQPGR